MYQKKTFIRKGISLIAVTVSIGAAGIILGSFVHLATTESKIQSRDYLMQEAKQAAESLANYAAAELVHQFENEPLNAFQNYSNKELELPTDVVDFFKDSHIDTASLSVKIVPETGGLQTVYIDANDPANQDDPQKGRYIFARNMRILAEATAKPHSKSKTAITQYAELTLQLRDSPFFSNAIFYNMDLELIPDTRMDVYGPVFSNYDIYLSSNEGLYFHDSVTASGAIKHGTKVLDGGKAPFSLGEVFFTDDENKLISMKRDPASDGKSVTDWIDNQTANSQWTAEAIATWGSEVQDESHSMPQVNPAGFDSYVEDNPNTAANEKSNSGYAIIEPVLAHDHPDAKSTAIRQQKLAYNAGLVLRVTGTSRSGIPFKNNDGSVNSSFVPSTYQVNAFKYKKDDEGNVSLDSNGNPEMLEVKLPAGVIGDANSNITAIENDGQAEVFKNYVGKFQTTSQTPVWETEKVDVEKTVAHVEWWINNKYDNQVDKEKDKFNNLGTGGADNVVVIDWDAEQKKLDDKIASIENNRKKDLTWLAGKDPDGDGKYAATKNVQVKDENGDKIQKTDDEGELVYDNETKTHYRRFVEEGFIDSRQNKQMDALYIDVDRLRQLSDDKDADYKAEDWETDIRNNESLKNFNPSEDWNGVVYVEFPHSQNSGRSDHIATAKDPKIGLVVINGENIPDRDKKGFSLASNGAVYVVGNYNADGDLSTGDANHYETGESPALIAGDSITVLSQEFKNTDTPPASFTSELKDYKASGRRQVPTGANTGLSVYKNAVKVKTPVEISAALMAGVAPTISYGNSGTTDLQSGGAHNFIRFLQKWEHGNKAPQKLLYRGSIVALFENELHQAKIPGNYEHIYTPPQRIWGYNNLFKEGIFPPGTPKGRTYRRKALKFPTYEEYTEKTKNVATKSS